LKVLAGQELTQYPLVYRYVANDMFQEACDGLRHAPGNARLAKSKALAVASHQLVVAALPAAPPQESVRLDAALKKGVELVHDEARGLGTGAVLRCGR